jgi:chemotaxis protein methyltransferase CheR
MTTSLEALDDAAFAVCLKLIHELTGITIGLNRKSMVEGRLRRRATALNLTSYATYLKLVRENSSERQVFIDLVTTNETYFYRTPRIWQFIAEDFLPKWFGKHKDRALNAWSAAASSGEEAHTLAILLQAFRDRNPGFSYQILGTDISQEMVRYCEAGTYEGRSIESFRNSKPDLFARYMEKASGESYRVKSELALRLKFQTHNLFKPLASRGPFDLILVRNVLIYFTSEDQQAVIAQLEPKLAPDGVMIIGESESLSRLTSSLKPRAPLVYAREAA